MPRNRSTNVSASPTAAAETVIATLPGLVISAGASVDIEASCDVTIGTAGTAATLRLREGATAAGLLIATYGPATVVAANRVLLTINGVDNINAEQDGLQYALTLQVTAATGVSTVNGVYLGAIW